MKSKIKRGAFRGKRSAAGKRFVLRPPTKRTALLSGTALASGILVAMAAIVAMPKPAMAACAPLGENFMCDGDPPAGAFTFDTGVADVNDWVGTLIGTNDLLISPAANTGQLTITNNEDYSGVVHVQAGASIDTAVGSGLVLTNTAPDDSTVTLNLNGSIRSTSSAGGTASDAVRVQGATVIVNVGSDAELDGFDDGIRVAGTATTMQDQFTLNNNGGTIIGRGSLAGLDLGFGVEVNGGGGPNPGTYTLVTANVTINNNGLIQGGINETVGNAGNLGAGIMVATSGTTTIINGYNAGQDSDPSLESQIVGGRWGILVSQPTGGGAVRIDNFGHIGTTDGNATAGIDVTTQGAITIRNLSMATIETAGIGINAVGTGAPILIYNGDDSVNPDPIPDNPDGRIIAGGIGINAENTNGGNIEVYNGLASDSNSQLFAAGNYGIHARSRSDGAGEGFVDVFNYGLVQLEGDGIAGVYVRSSADVDGYAAFFNGAVDFMDDGPIA